MYFIMITNLPGGLSPIMEPHTNCNEKVREFTSLVDANNFADNNRTCQAFGYEIFQLGCGEV